MSRRTTRAVTVPQPPPAGLQLIREVSALTNVPPRTIARWAQERRIEAVKYGPRLWYVMEDVQLLAETLKRGPKPQTGGNSPRTSFTPAADRTAPSSRMKHPLREERQADGRIRRWARISEMDDCALCVILLGDGETVHNAFFHVQLPLKAVRAAFCLSSAHGRRASPSASVK